MAEGQDPGTPERDLPWRERGDEGRGSESNDSRRRSANFPRRRTRGSESSQPESSGETTPHEGTNPRIWFKIPESQIGRLIGRRGRKIKDLQDQTDTYIHVRRDETAGKVKVYITGAPESQRKCKRMILDMARDCSKEPRRRRRRSEEAPRAEARTRDENEDRFEEVDWDAIRERINEQERMRLARLVRFQKYFYVEAQEVAEMSEEYVQELRRSLNNMTVSLPYGGDVKIPNPVETFDQAFHFYPRLLNQLREHNFTTPFPIQCQGWPVLLTGNDMIGIAQTGTGKTLAFLLPALVHIDGQTDPPSERNGPNVLIIAPTRELALQIDGEAKKFPYFGIRSACIYGGGDRREQLRELQQGVNMVIGTPGRLNDCILTGALKLETVTFLVLDEADHMLELGFERQIRRMLLTIRPDRQTVMTSATWPLAIQNLAEKYMRQPIKITIGSRNLSAVHTVKQIVFIVNEDQKYDRLLEVIGTMSPTDKMIVFVGKRIVADSLASDLILDRIHCQSIHGNRVQSDREQALDDLRTGEVRILVATDVASRGLDIEDVTKVVNFDFPRSMEEYVHRVGRTGRAGRTGEAITLFTRENRAHADELISILEEAGQVVPDGLFELSSRQEEHPRAGARASRRGRRHRR